MNNIKNAICILLYITISVLLSSCNFNITDIPGPQVSSTIESSKNHGAFICAFKIDGNQINGIRVESIFAEKKYWLETGLFGKFEINCCESQLIITFKEDDKIVTLNDIPQNWEIIGFESRASKILVKNYNKIIFPDSIAIDIRPNVKNNLIFEKLTLVKVL